MTNDQLKRANDITERIETLKTHLGRLDDVQYEPSRVQPLTLNLTKQSYTRSVHLLGDLLNMDEFLELYKMRVQKEIGRLEKEFESL